MKREQLSEAEVDVIRRLGHRRHKEVNAAIMAVSGVGISQRILTKYRKRFGIVAEYSAGGEASGRLSGSGESEGHNGYRLMRSVVDGRAVWRPKHKVLWEAENGPTPKGHRLMCIDGDKGNSDPSNWRLVPHGAVAAASIHGPIKLRDAPAEMRATLIALAELKTKVKAKVKS